MGPSVQYWVAVAAVAAPGAWACLVTRRRGGATAVWVGRTIGTALASVALGLVLHVALDGTWTERGALPLSLCDVALVVGAVTCWLPGWLLGVELTYFWGLAATLPAVLMPDLSARFPQPGFVAFVVGHVAIVLAACYLVLGLRVRPRRDAVVRVGALTLGYTALIGLVNVATGSNYMYLARPPRHASLLSALGPWPWYLVGAAGIGLALFVLLDLPFRVGRAGPDAAPARYTRPLHQA